MPLELWGVRAINGLHSSDRVQRACRPAWTHHAPPRERSHHPRVAVRNGSGPNQRGLPRG